MFTSSRTYLGDAHVGQRFLPAARRLIHECCIEFTGDENEYPHNTDSDIRDRLCRANLRIGYQQRSPCCREEIPLSLLLTIGAGLSLTVLTASAVLHVLQSLLDIASSLLPAED